MKKLVLFVLILLLATACQPTVQTIEVPGEQVVVTKEVEVVKEVEVIKEVEVVKEVQVEKAGAFTVGILHPEMNAFHSSISNSVTERGGDKGWWIIPFTAGVDSAKQLDQMENLILLEVDAILITPVDAKAICAGVKKAKEAGIPVFGIDRSTIGCEINMTVQSDNEMAGRQGAQGAVNFLMEKYGEPKGIVLELQGDMASNVAQLRNKGFKEEMAKYPDVTVISKPTEWDQDKFYKNTLDVVGSQPVDAIFSHTDVIGTTPILSALDQLGKLYKVGEDGHIWYGAVDGSPTGLAAIRDGYQDESYSQPNTDVGIVLDFMEKELLMGESIQAGTFTEEGALWSPAEIFQSENGWMMLLATSVVNIDNVDDPRLWGNG